MEEDLKCTPRCALAIFSGRIIFIFGVQESLRTFLNPFFTGAFRPESHVSGRKSQTIKQSAQKGGAKFGGDAFDRFREKTFEKQNDELKRVIATK